MGPAWIAARRARLLVPLLLICLWPTPHASGQERQRAFRDAILVNTQDPGAAAKRLRVLRHIDLAEIRKKPVVKVGDVKIDFAPMLRNPASTFNTAQRLRALSRHVELKGEETTISEIDQGLVVHSHLSYRVRPGACGEAAARAQLKAAGVSCAVAVPPRQHAQLLASPGNPRYIKDPAKRAHAIAQYEETLRQSQAKSGQRIAELRRALADPKQHAAFASRFGAEEVQRVKGLSDEQLKEHIVNSAVIDMEQVMFVPRARSLAHLPKITALGITPDGAHRARERFAAAPPPPQPHPASAAQPHYQAKASFHREPVKLGPYIYLTGFTIGHDYEWSVKLQATINWCVFWDCSETYMLRPFAGFSYGFGLRFPIETRLLYSFDWRGANDNHASVKVDFTPIDGNAEQYRRTGLAPNLLYSGQELVAEATATAGVEYSMPILGHNTVNALQVGFSLPDHLPAPFTHGQFTPPAPGTTGLTGDPIYVRSLDLLGDTLNIGVASVAVVPAVKVGLTSSGLAFTLVDNVARQTTTVSASGQTYPLKPGADQYLSSHFTLRDPVYNLQFHVTPGVDPNVSIDIEVWSHTWDAPIWFPQLEIDIPQGGIDFHCHDGTTCSYDFNEPGLTTPMEKARKLPANLYR